MRFLHKEKEYIIKYAHLKFCRFIFNAMQYYIENIGSKIKADIIKEGGVWKADEGWQGGEGGKNGQKWLTSYVNGP